MKGKKKVKKYVNKYIENLTNEERLAILGYDEINNNFGGLKYYNKETFMKGNRFGIDEMHKNIFGKRKFTNLVMLFCACGVSVQTFIDILTSYNFDLKRKKIKFSYYTEVEEDED